jgi:hypothetical protein
LPSAEARFGLLIASAVIVAVPAASASHRCTLKLTFDLNDRVLVVGLVVAALSAVGSSLVPAWKSTRTDLVSNLKSQASDDLRRSRLWGRNILVCGQVALSLVLLTVAVFLFRAYQSEYGRGPGFRIDHVLLMSFEPDLAGYDAPRADRFYDQLRDRASAIPGVTSVALTSSVPFDASASRTPQWRPKAFSSARERSLCACVRRASTRGTSTRSDSHRRWPAVSSGRWAGRASRRRRQQNVRVAILAGRNAVGRRFQLINDAGVATWVEIVGIAMDSRYRNISEGPTEFIYYPRRQISAPDATILLHTSGDPQAFASPLRAAVRAIDPDMPVFGVRTMEDFYRASSVAVTNLLIELVGGMGTLGLALSIVGLYGLVAYSVNRRTREIGIRMAVGASPVSFCGW